MSLVIFVGGATACGKSTFTNELNNSICGSKKYRRYQGFFDIAVQKGIPKEKIFEQVTSESVDDWFVDVCKDSDIVISDVHYAVQMDRNNDTLGRNQDINIYQEYVPTISKELLQKLIASDIKVIALHLSCSPEICLSRAIGRFNKNEKELRTQSLEDAKLENYAERREWANIAVLDSVKGIELNSEVNFPMDLVSQCLNCLNNLLKEDKGHQLIKKYPKSSFDKVED